MVVNAWWWSYIRAKGKMPRRTALFFSPVGERDFWHGRRSIDLHLSRSILPIVVPRPAGATKRARAWRIGEDASRVSFCLMSSTVVPSRTFFVWSIIDRSDFSAASFVGFEFSSSFDYVPFGRKETDRVSLLPRRSKRASRFIYYPEQAKVSPFNLLSGESITDCRTRIVSQWLEMRHKIRHDWAAAKVSVAKIKTACCILPFRHR